MAALEAAEVVIPPGGAVMTDSMSGISVVAQAQRPEREQSGGNSSGGTARAAADPLPDRLDPSAMTTEEFLDKLCNDQVKRWRAGQRVPAEAYLALYPSVRDASEAAFELIYGEFLLREELGESPPLEEFRWRFPRYANRLQRQLDLHGALSADDTIVEPAGHRLAPAAFPDNGSAAIAPRSLAPGFQVLGELGRGGMGAVYKAYQVSLKRVVALKVIRAQAYADSSVSARFQAEAEAAARLQHPNIVQVFEVGEHDGLGYLVLEYVAGGSLDRRLAGLLQDPHDSALLLETLARAIHHAHLQGIVHRDLKPANVLLTEDGVPKISDFGLAKLLERDQELTLMGDVVGTPSYMAPEQIRGLASSITPVTDVYALGAILYEMLTGRPPFKGTTPLSTMEQVTTQEPLAPGKLQRHTPADLETICLKCLEKDPRRRYGSALELASDLRRFLEGQPVLARPTPAWERAWKWARRHKSATAAMGSIVTAVTVLLGGALYYNSLLHDAVRQARSAERVSQRSAQVALDQRNLALQAFKGLVYDVQEKLGQTPRTRSLRQNLLDTAIAGLDEVVGNMAGSIPDLSQAVAHQKLGDIFRIVGRSPVAFRHYEQARQISEALLDAEPGDLAVADVLYQTQMGLGHLKMDAHRFAEAKLEFVRAATISESITAADQALDSGRRGLIEAYLQIGRAHSFMGDFAEAETWFRKMQVLAGHWTTEEPDNRVAFDLLASSYRKLGDLEKFAKQYPGAQQDYLSGIEIGRDLVAAEPDNLEFKLHLATALDDLAGIVRDQGHFAPARQLFQEAADLFAELVATDPDRLGFQVAALHTTFHQAALERDDSEYPAAARLFRQTRAGLRSLAQAGRIGPSRITFFNSADVDEEIAFCDAAPRALAEAGFARTQPPAQAARLLLLRAHTLAGPDDRESPAAAARALQDLSAHDPEGLFGLARMSCRFAADLDSGSWPGLQERQRAALRQASVARAGVLLTQAVEHGFDDVDRIKSGDLAVLRKTPGYQAALERLARPKASQPKAE